MSEQITSLTDVSYEQDVQDATTPVIVDFWAPWCGPCRMMAPVMEQLADEYEGKVRFAKMNTDENPDTPSRLGIRGIPTLVVYVDGEEADRLTGYAAKPVLKERLDAILTKATTG